MNLTSFSDYTLRVLMFLALHPDRLVTIGEVAAAFEISRNHLMKVVHALAQSGEVQSVRGKGGGLRLARPAAEIRLGAIIRRSEGDTPIVECLGPSEPAACRIAAVCRLKGALVAGFNALYEALDSYTLADLVANEAPLRLSLLGQRPPRSDSRITAGR